MPVLLSPRSRSSPPPHYGRTRICGPFYWKRKGWRALDPMSIIAATSSISASALTAAVCVNFADLLIQDDVARIFPQARMQNNNAKSS
jgi:hypothetical protein